MDLFELKGLVDFAIDDCQSIIFKNPKCILSEGDLERILSNCISKRIGYVAENSDPNGFSVYSQISHYNNEKEEIDARVDILLMKTNRIIESFDHNKRFVYRSNESFAIELKYLHADNRGCITAAKSDIDKYVRYRDDSHYYAVVLLDKNDRIEDYKRDIMNYYMGKKEQLGAEYENKFFCKVLQKPT